MVMEADLRADRKKRPEEMRARTLAGGETLREITPPTRLALTPAPECRKLSRGISRATDNEGLVWALRSSGDSTPELSTHHVFLLPDIGIYPQEFRTFIERDLLEMAALATLESSERLNWWPRRIPGAPRLLPLATSGDGNCLPHAASLAAWGFHDRLLALRSRIHDVLSGREGAELAAALKRRWRWSEAAQLSRAGLTPTEREWEAEWSAAVAAATVEPRPAPDAVAPPPAPHYHGLDQLHVLALAHVMRRPILVFADVVLRDFRGDPIAPIPFGGIYLPLETDPSLCSKAPVLLAYDAGHFSALVPSEPLPASGALIPLEDAMQQPLPVRFIVDPGEEFRWEREVDQRTLNNLLPDEFQRSAMLGAYLDLERAECSLPGGAHPLEDFRRSLDALSSKSSKQMTSVAKQFGSIGKSMSSKLMRNFGSASKLSKSGGEGPTGRRLSTCEVLCCRVLAARAPVQEEMVQNYLEDAWQRYTRETAGARDVPSSPRYGTGRSRFYAEADTAAHESARNMHELSNRPAIDRDRTLYLSKSTFYDDRPPSPPFSPLPCRAPLCLYYGSAQNGGYCSRCAPLRE